METVPTIIAVKASGSDDTAALASAIKAANVVSSGGAQVSLSDVYAVSSVLPTITKPGVSVVGTGSGKR